MADVVGLAMAGGPDFVSALQSIWDDGDAVLPLPVDQPDADRRRTIEALRPASIIDADGIRQELSDGLATDDGDALVMRTSGTTGRPKGVVLTHAAVEASARATTARLGVEPSTAHWLACLPLHHIGGLAVVTRALATHTELTVLAGFDRDAVPAAARAGATHVSLVATALRRIQADLFETIVLGGARPPADLPANVVTTYGMTETGSGVVYDGRPLDGVEVDIVDDGTIRLRGPMLLRAYRDGSTPLDEDGWLATGDLGRWERDRLVVDGRRDDLIITGGENVWPEPVEDLIAAVAGVADVIVVGHDDPEWGQRVVAYVVATDPDRPPRLEQLNEAVRAELPGFHAPKELQLADALPRTAGGKPRRSVLRS